MRTSRKILRETGGTIKGMRAALTTMLQVAHEYEGLVIIKNKRTGQILLKGRKSKQIILLTEPDISYEY